MNDKARIAYLLQLAANMVLYGDEIDSDQLRKNGYSLVKLDDTLKIYGWCIGIDVKTGHFFAEPMA